MKSTNLTVCYSFEADCPYCEAQLDLADQDEDGFYSIPIFNNEWENLVGEEVLCPDCGKKFVISSVST